MAWKKVSDNAGTHPRVMETAALLDADERTVNEVMGFISRLAAQSAAHTTDYVVDLGTVQMIGMSRWKVLVDQCTTVGLMEPVAVDGRRAYKLLEDPELFHIRSRKEIQWERQRQRDTSDPHIIVHVVRRDGDNCRWCRVLVQWRGRKSNRTGTYDHLNPGQAASVETMVVACQRCNTSRQDNPRWADDHPLLPEPKAPQYGKWTADYLTENGYPTDPNVGAVIDPTNSAGSAPAAPVVAAQERPAAAADTDPGPSEVPAGCARESPANVTYGSVPSPMLSRSLGSGRDGTGLGLEGKGLVGQGQAGSGRAGPGRAGRGSGSGGAPPGDGARRRRGRRGGGRR